MGCKWFLGPSGEGRAVWRKRRPSSRKTKAHQGQPPVSLQHWPPSLPLCKATLFWSVSPLPSFPSKVSSQAFKELRHARHKVLCKCITKVLPSHSKIRLLDRPLALLSLSKYTASFISVTRKSPKERKTHLLLPTTRQDRVKTLEMKAEEDLPHVA